MARVHHFPDSPAGAESASERPNPRIISCRDFLRYDAQGKLDVPAMREALRAMAENCARTGVRHAVLDVREITDAPAIGELFWLADELASLGFACLERLAIVYVDRGQGRANFFATTARTRGFNIREFTSFERAFEWLSTTSPVGE